MCYLNEISFNLIRNFGFKSNPKNVVVSIESYLFEGLVFIITRRDIRLVKKMRKHNIFQK
jgi:hypothetical protein